MAQSVEHVLGKDEVTSSSLVSSSKEKLPIFRQFFLCFNELRIGEKSLATFLCHFGYTDFALSRAQNGLHFLSLSETA